MWIFIWRRINMALISSFVSAHFNVFNGLKSDTLKTVNAKTFAVVIFHTLKCYKNLKIAFQWIVYKLFFYITFWHYIVFIKSNTFAPGFWNIIVDWGYSSKLWYIRITNYILTVSLMRHAIQVTLAKLQINILNLNITFPHCKKKFRLLLNKGIQLVI